MTPTDTERPLHVLIATDQHIDSLGGVQVSIRLQRAALESLGHTVSVLSGARLVEHAPGPGDIELQPTRHLTRDREYGATWPGRRGDRIADAALRAQADAGRPPVDLVHVQGDLWGAIAGYRLARRHGLPVVHTMHNNLHDGITAISPLAAPPVFFGMNAVRRALLGGPPVRGERSGWRYLATLARQADAIIAPSRFFAAELERHRIGPATVIPTGVDDAVIDSVLAGARSRDRTRRSRPRLVWLGRVSQEKRVLELIEALQRSEADADLDLYGSGIQLDQVRSAIERGGLGDRVRLHDRLPYPEALAVLAEADALMQTSLGFETQGMTPYEAAALGTPTVFRDERIAAELAVGEQGLHGWVAQGPSVDDYAAALRLAVQELAQGPVRITGAADRFRQRHQTERTVELYRSVLDAATRSAALAH